MKGPVKQRLGGLKIHYDVNKKMMSGDVKTIYIEVNIRTHFAFLV